MRPSIRRRLLLWLSPTLLLAGMAFAVPAWLNVHEELDELFDKVLREMAYSELTFAVRSNSAESRLSPSPQTDDIDLISQEWDLKGHLLYRSHPFAPLSAPPRGEGLSTVDWRGDSWRVFNLKARDRWIQIAQAESERRQTANEVALHLLMPLLLLLPGLALLVWFSIGRGLRPLQEIVDAVEQRTPQSLHPIPDRDLPHDVNTLVNALNGLLHRLDEALAAQRRFLAYAAHELRTPLTALSLQAQVAERATDLKKRSIALANLRQGIDRASRLVQQLLTLARLDPEAADRPFASVRLDQLARAVVADQVPLAADLAIDLGLAATEPALVSGDDEALRILLS